MTLAYGACVTFSEAQHPKSVYGPAAELEFRCTDRLDRGAGETVEFRCGVGRGSGEDPGAQHCGNPAALMLCVPCLSWGYGAATAIGRSGGLRGGATGRVWSQVIDVGSQDRVRDRKCRVTRDRCRERMRTGQPTRYRPMEIRSVVHRGLRRLIEGDDEAGFQPAVAKKLRYMVSFLAAMEREEDVLTIRSWRARRLSGRRKGTWSLMVTGNWRLTFQIASEQSEIVELNYEDYH